MSTEGSNRIQELEAKVAELSALVEQPKVSSRRGMLKLAAGAAAGAVAATAVGTGNTAAAATGDPVRAGQSTTADAGDLTLLVGVFEALGSSSPTNAGIASTSGTIVGHDTSTDASRLRGGVVGLAGPFLLTASNQPGYGVVGRNFAGGATGGGGVYGLSDATTAGVGAGLRARSVAGPTILLDPVLAGVPTTGTWARGSLLADTSGRLWYCTVGGTPGTWVDLAAPFPTIPTFHALTPFRAYDSREPQPSAGALSLGGTRTISIKDKRAVAGGAVVTADLVPAGATAVTANVTVVDTVQSGFLTVNPGGVTEINAATVNWSATGQILNNGVNLTISATREVTVIAGGAPGSSTHFVIDITGYFG
jgi:hypothetical protein